MIRKLVRTPGIYLIGFMGCGKTTVGRLLADELGWGFVDIDEDIEKKEKVSIAEIFDSRGEEVFRALETAALHSQVHMIQCGRPMVVALGGGAFTREENYGMVEENGVTLWLDCALETLHARVADAATRPLARDPRRFADLYHARRDSYTRADFRIDASAGDPAAVLAEILRLPLF